MTDELAAYEFTVVGIALDESADRLDPFIDGVTFPILLDRDHRTAELLAISNVPTVLWVDEDDRIVRPNAAEFGTDTFAEFSGIFSGPHLDQVRSWVIEGTEPPAEEHDAVVDELTDDEVDARLHFRMAVHLQREGDDAASASHFAAAEALAPLDFSIARASMPLTGRDPFGEEFFALLERWNEAGRPYHGLSRSEHPGVDDS